MANDKVIVIAGGNDGTGSGLGELIAAKLAGHGVKAIVSIECRSNLPMVEPTMIGLSKKDRRDRDKQHWKVAKRYGKK
jgi:NAD(P)-dependent dehydrogenase (short-subunit alcohol dehydrogenase family)